MKEGSQAEADNKVLSVVEREDATGMLLGKAFAQQISIALRGLLAEFEIDESLLIDIGVFLAQSVSVLPDRTQVEHFLEIEFSFSSSADIFAIMFSPASSTVSSSVASDSAFARSA